MIRVRAAQPDERAVVRHVVDVAYAEFASSVSPADHATMRRNLVGVLDGAAPGNLLVAEWAGVVIGTVTYLPPGPRDYTRVPFEWAVIRALAVHPNHRGLGAGRLLSERCVDRARQEGAPAVGLHTSELMDRAQALYEAMGFVRMSEFGHLGVRFWIYALQLEG